MKRKCWLICLTLILPSSLWGQASSASLQGAVQDQSGAAIPGVTITVTSTDTGSVREVLTNDTGVYRVPLLDIGSYEVKAELAGFRAAVRRGIRLTVGMQAVVNLELAVGETQQVVEVLAGAPLVQTTASDISELVDSQKMRDLPLNGRNFIQLATLQVGVANSDRVRGTNSTIAGAGMRFNVNGTRYNDNSFLLDGQNIQDTFNSTPSSGGGETLGVDTLQEFEVKTANYSAEYSKAAGAVINAVTKSGTNEVHGSAFMFHRNDNLDARNFFDRQKPEFRRNQFGATLGGPIVKNKTFAFGGFEAVRQSQAFTRTFTVPTLEAKAGRLRNPASGQIEQIQIAPQVVPFLALFPLTPNGRDFGDGRAEHIAIRNDVKNVENFVIKIDQRAATADSISVRYQYDNGSFLQQTGPVFSFTLPSRNQFLSIQTQKIFSPSVVNSLRIGYNRSHLISDDIPAIDLPASVRFGATDRLGVIAIGGYSGPGNGILTPRDFVLNVFDLNETLTITRGNHLVKLGANVERLHSNILNSLWADGQYTFSTWSDFLRARPSLFVSAAPGADAARGFRQWLFGGFIQDDMKVNSRLTMNLGLRYEAVSVPTEVNGKLANVRSLTASEVTIGQPFENPSLLNFAPRLGLAWDVTGSGRMAVRAGFGMFHSQILPNQYRTVLTGNAPYARNVQTASPIFPDALATAQNAPTSNVWSFPFKPEQPAVYQWNLTLQRQFPAGIVASAGYVGSRGTHLPRALSGQDANLPVPTIVNGRKFFAAGLPRLNAGFAQIRHVFYDSMSSYHGLQVSVRRRAERFALQTSYTFSKSVDDASGIWGGAGDFAGSPSPQDILDRLSDRAVSAFDVRHSFSTNFSYVVPNVASAGPGRILNGWQVNGIVSLSTAFPFTVLADGAPDRDRDRSTSAIRPNLVQGRSQNPIVGDPLMWFDATAFSLPDPGFYGTLGRNTLRGDAFTNFDFALTKNTQASENLDVQFRTEIFNLFNHANFSIPSVTTIFVGNNPSPLANSGQVTATANSARQIQFGLKLIW